MGAFFLVRKNETELLDDIERKYSEALNVFSEMGLKCKLKIINNDVCLFIYDKYFFSPNNYYFIDSTNFILSTGTLFYKSKIEIDALKLLYSDLKSFEKLDIIDQIRGNYALIYCINGNLYVLNDRNGIYHLFTTSETNIISNSFLALAKAIDKKTVQLQEVFEYILMGTIYGDKTVFREINLINKDSIVDFNSKKTINKNVINIPEIKEESIDYFLKRYESILHSVFYDLKVNFESHEIYSALTGGYDTRLMLASMRKEGIDPSCYVHDNGSLDLCISEKIAKSENINLKVNTYIESPKIGDDEYYSLMRKSYYMNDAKNDSGIFYQGFDWLMRTANFKEAKIHLNGFGGELLRNAYGLADKSIDFDDFFKIRYDKYIYKDFTQGFDKKLYFQNLKTKFNNIVKTKNNILSRQDVQILIAYNHYQYWAGINQSLKGRYTHSFAPLMDHDFVLESFSIPMKYKNYGTFIAKLINTLDPNLAKYISQYGYMFSEGPTIRYKIKELLRYNLPLNIRPFLRKFYFNNTNSQLTENLTQSKINLVFNNKPLYLSEFFNVPQIPNQNILSRFYTTELLINNIF